MKANSLDLGFTLVELLTTVAIVSLLAGLALANFKGYQSRANDSKAISQLKNAYVALQALPIDLGPSPPDGFINIRGDGTVSITNAVTYGATAPGNLSDYSIDQLMPGFEHEQDVVLHIDPRRQFAAPNRGHFDPVVYTRHCDGSPDNTSGCSYPSKTFWIHASVMTPSPISQCFSRLVSHGFATSSGCP